MNSPDTAKLSLRKKLDGLIDLVQNLPVGICTFDNAGLVMSWNAACEEILGWTADEVLDQPLPFKLDPIDQEFGGVLGLLLAGESFSELEVAQQRKDGSAIDVSLSTVPIRNADGEICGAMATLADIKSDQSLVSEETYSQPGYTVEAAEAKAEGRPDVRAAQSAVDLSDAYLLQAHGEHLPTLAVQGDYYLLKDGSFPQPLWNVQLVASLPLFEGGQIMAQEDQAASKKRQAELQLSLARRMAADDIRQAYKSLVDSTGETDAYQKAVQAYEQAYQDVLHDYKLNLTTNLELLQTMTSLENTKISYIKAKYQALYDQV